MQSHPLVPLTDGVAEFQTPERSTYKICQDHQAENITLALSIHEPIYQYVTTAVGKSHRDLQLQLPGCLQGIEKEHLRN